MTKTAMKLLDDILNMLVSFQATGQEPQVLTSDRMSALVERMNHNDLAGKGFSIGGGSFSLPSSGITRSWADEDCYVVGKVPMITH